MKILMKGSQRTVKEKDQFVVALICPLAQKCAQTELYEMVQLS
jgi:hypothetical protein